jgi:hypothetical protein
VNSRTTHRSYRPEGSIPMSASTRDFPGNVLTLSGGKHQWSSYARSVLKDSQMTVSAFKNLNTNTMHESNG